MPLKLGGPRARQRAVLGCLLVHSGEAVSADRLIHALWDERPPSTAKTLIHGHIAQLRKLLEPERGRGEQGMLLATTPSGYVLRAEARAVDSHVFEDLMAEGNEAIEDGRHEEAARLLRKALELWRGPAFGDLADESWARLEAGRLNELRVACLEDRLEADLRLGRHSELIGELEALVSAEPLRERPRGQLMRALYAAGRQAEALEAYRETRRVLVDAARTRTESGAARAGSCDSATGCEPHPLARSRAEPLDPPADELPEAVPLLPPPPRSAAQERRVVGILVCDIDVSTLPRQADPEDVFALVRPCRRRVREEIERYGGTVENLVGDTVVGVFGAPVAHEDDAERALRAGLAILETTVQLNQEAPQPGVSARIGISTGEVVVALEPQTGNGDGALAGDVVNRAAQLEALAPAGAIVVGDETHALTKDIFDFAEFGHVLLKGDVEPVVVWQVLSARARFGSDMRSHDTALVGREVESALLRQLFERSVHDSAPQLVTIVGEPGVGKSRLVWELQSFIDAYPDLVAWRQGRCLPYGDGVIFGALAEIVKADAGILESDPPDVVATKLDRAVLTDEPDRDWLRNRLGSLAGIETSDPADRDELFTAWRRFLEAIASSRPAVFVFEDLHWADPALLAFLEHVAGWTEGVAITLVCTARPELTKRYPGWAGGTRNATTIHLAPLSDTETARLIGELVDRSALPPEVLTPIVERSGGNPLYAEEFVRMLTDRGLLARRGGSWALTAGTELPFPENVQALIAARLDTLSADQRALLQDAAVIGKVFWAGAVASMGARGERDVRDALHELSKKDIVRRLRTTTIEAEAEYSFLHVLSRDVAYGQILRSQRMAKHQAAAEWIEKRAGERLADVADVLAYHAIEALELAVAAGLDEEAETLRAQGRRYLFLAGERARHLDVGRAMALFQRAESLMTQDDPFRPRVMELLGDAAYQAGMYPRSEGGFAEGVKLYRAHGDDLGAGRCMIGQARAIYRTRGVAPAEKVLLDAIRILSALEPGAALGDAYELRAYQLYTAGRDADAIEWADRALELQQTLGLPDGARALTVRGGVRAARGERDGVEDIRRAIELARAAEDTNQTASALNNCSLAAAPFEGPAVALQLVREGIGIARRRGHAAARHSTASALDFMLDLGLWDELIEDGNALLAEVGEDPWEALFARQTLAVVHLARGEEPLAAPHLLGLLERAREFGELQMIMPALWVTALARTNDDQQAGILYLEELERLSGLRDAFNFPNYLPRVVRLAVALGEGELAQLIRTGVDPITPLHQNALSAADAVLAESRGDLELAATLHSKAADQWQTFGHVVEQGWAELGRGRCLAKLRRGRAAGEALSRPRTSSGRSALRPFSSRSRSCSCTSLDSG